MSENKERAARMAGDNLQDHVDNDIDEGIALMRAKESWPTKEVIDYLNHVRRGKLIKSLMMALISQIPLILVLLTA